MAQIYALVDPRDKLIHYIGSAQDAFSRLNGHLRSDETTKKGLWISELDAIGLQPELVILATVPDDDRFTEEYKWIYLARVSGWPLTNTSAMMTGRYVGLADSVSSSVERSAEDDRSAVYHDKQSLIDMLRANHYMPIMVDGDIVHLVRPEYEEERNVAILGIIRMTSNGRRYINCRGWNVPISQLSESAIALMGDYTDLYGRPIGQYESFVA